MRPALARHDAIARRADRRPSRHRREADRRRRLRGLRRPARRRRRRRCELQLALADPAATNGVPLRVRCGLHTGTIEHRDNDYFGSAVNRGARIMGAAHGGQVILSQAVVDQLAGRLPDGVTLRDLGSVRLRDLDAPRAGLPGRAPRLRQDFPALRSLEATPNNLPQQVSSFVGREGVLAAGQEAVRDDAPADAARRGRPRQDAALAAGRRRRAGRLSGRRLVRRAGAARRSPARAAGGGLGARRGRRVRAPGAGGAGQARRGPAAAARSSTTASTSPTPAPSWPRRCCRRARR